MPTTSLPISYHATSYSARYTFSGKERDEETGYSYFGARYYNSSYSIWLSVDPMSDKYPSLSPYAYCADNPVKLVDVDGEEVYIFGDQQMNAFNSLQKKTKLKISIDKYGKITAEGKATNRDDRKLLKAINSTNARVEIDASKEHTSNDSGGSFMGTSYDADNNTATSCNHINMSIVNKKETNNSDKGSTVMHEITEGFEACKISIRKKCDILPAQKQWGKVVKYVIVESQDAMDNTKTSTSIQRQTYYDWLPVNTKAYRLYLKAHYRATQPMEGY